MLQVSELIISYVHWTACLVIRKFDSVEFYLICFGFVAIIYLKYNALQNFDLKYFEMIV